MPLLILCVVVIVFVVLKRKQNMEIKEKQACQYAIELANKYVNAFNNREGIARLNSLSEDVIEMSAYYWAKYDIASYSCLLEAAKEISYMYQGNKYPHDLVEDLIREQRR